MHQGPFSGGSGWFADYSAPSYIDHTQYEHLVHPSKEANEYYARPSSPFDEAGSLASRLLERPGRGSPEFNGYHLNSFNHNYSFNFPVNRSKAVNPLHHFAYGFTEAPTDDSTGFTADYKTADGKNYYADSHNYLFKKSPVYSPNNSSNNNNNRSPGKTDKHQMESAEKSYFLKSPYKPFVSCHQRPFIDEYGCDYQMLYKNNDNNHSNHSSRIEPTTSSDNVDKMMGGRFQESKQTTCEQNSPLNTCLLDNSKSFKQTSPHKTTFLQNKLVQHHLPNNDSDQDMDQPTSPTSDSYPRMEYNGEDAPKKVFIASIMATILLNNKCN